MFSRLSKVSRVCFKPTSGLMRPLFGGVRRFSNEGPFTETERDFLGPDEFYNMLKDNGLSFYTGVPDSLLKDYCAYVADNSPPENHVMTANEGASVAVATGYHLATRKHPVVYMQNSGFGNTVNPLLSLADPKVYSVPMLLLIGWRGEPGKKDEPQHLVQGKVMSSLLTDMGIQFEVLPDYLEGAQNAIDTAVHYMNTRKAPYALLVKRQTFQKYKLTSLEEDKQHLSREEALELLCENLNNFDALVSTTGFTSRELYELREKRGEDHRREFLTVGSMGHSAGIALGIALSKPSRQIICVDGDGSLMMHMGTMATVGLSKPKNFKHILINNGCHDSVGGQTTGGFHVDFCQIAKSCGYVYAESVSEPSEVAEKIKAVRAMEGPAFLEITVNKGARKDLGRPKSSPIENKTQFMDFLNH